MTYLEKLARAADPAAWDLINSPSPSAEYRRKHSLETVRAILIAMREPSEEMVCAGETELDPYMEPKFSTVREITAEAWQAMLDAALADPMTNDLCFPKREA